VLAVLFNRYGNKQASPDTFFGKNRRRLDIENNTPTPTAYAVDESNVEDRSVL